MFRGVGRFTLTILGLAAGLALGMVAPIAPVLVSTQSAAAGTDDTHAAHQDYLHHARIDMETLHRRLEAWNGAMRARTDQTGSRARVDLNNAWTEASNDWRRLQSVSAEGWEKARVSYEQAYQRLREEWHRVNPEG